VLALVLDCASPARIAPIDTPLETGTESQLSVASSQHLEVPFHAQASRQCGPASLAMVLNFTGIEGSPEKLAEQVYTTGRGGSLQTDLVASARRIGRDAPPSELHLRPRAEALRFTTDEFGRKMAEVEAREAKDREQYK